MTPNSLENTDDFCEGKFRHRDAHVKRIWKKKFIKETFRRVAHQILENSSVLD